MEANILTTGKWLNKWQLTRKRCSPSRAQRAGPCQDRRAPGAGGAAGVATGLGPETVREAAGQAHSQDATTDDDDILFAFSPLAQFFRGYVH